MKIKKPIILMILDGFGIRKEEKYNAILNSSMNNYFNLYNNYPHTHLHASGPLVGLPLNQIGSSEVGHMTIGAGQLIKQPIVRINEEIENNEFFNNKILNKGLNFIKKSKGNIHIMGLLGNGGVHSSDKHLYAFIDFYDKNADNITGNIFIHNFLDGRDTAQKSAIKFIQNLQNKIDNLKNKHKFFIASICGRYYAMDRDNRWERTQLAYDMLVYSKANKKNSPIIAIENSYKEKIYDEFVKPVIFHHKNIKDNDLCVFYNFRADRPKQLLKAFLDKNFDKFYNKKFKNLKFQTLTQYSEDIKTEILYPTIYPKNTLGEIISKKKLNQLRISESEKYPHVTYFFSGLNDKKLKGETRIKIDSPKVKTYDLKPEMSCIEVTDKLISEINKNIYDFIVINYANSDMVGHTANYKAIIKALDTVDSQIKRVKDKVDEINAILIITADHGNCETNRDKNNLPHTKHTYNLVPFILCNKNYKLSKDYKNLSLYNIAPTILELMNIKKPDKYEKSLIIK